MLNEFASWYIDRMAELLPGMARGQADEGPAEALVADVRTTSFGADGGLSLASRIRRHEKPLGTFATDAAGLARARQTVGARSWPDIVLLLPRGALLERVVTLPLAAEAGLAAVLGYEMDRYTPFTADEVHWTATVIARDREQERLRVRILLIPRTALATAVDVLAQLDLVPTLVESAGLDGARRLLPLRPPDEASRRTARRLLMVASALCVVLAAAVTALPFLRQSWAVDEVEARIATLQPSVNQADALRKQLTAQSAGNDVIAAEQLRLGEPLQAISALTQLIPDDTFLNVLTLHERQLGIDGQSASAARLIGLLSADPVIRNAAFAAPVTRAEDGADMFSLKAEVRS